MSKFLALDFETANPYPDSACAIGLVRVENQQVVEEVVHLIKPPQQWFTFTDIHGLTWEDVRQAPDFGRLWQQILHFFEGVYFISAHNAGFDTRVLSALCKRYLIEIPPMRSVCTVRLARKTWSIFPTKLSNVCSKLGIELNHHEALSDARACAQIVIQAQQKELAERLKEPSFELGN